MVEYSSEVAEGGLLKIDLRGRLDADSTASIWSAVLGRVESARPDRIEVNAKELDYSDGAGLALMVELGFRVHGNILFTELRDDIRELLDQFDSEEICRPPKQRRPTSLVPEVGRATIKFWRDLVELVVFVGHAAMTLTKVALAPSNIRWSEVWFSAEKVGVNALPIVALVGFLIGLIMAFQSAIPMQQFGVEVYVADLVAISMTRELGPLMAAVIVAGRSGSAFAAELGTMKVSEELSALETMGIDPVDFLVAIRMLATFFMIPFLSIFCCLFGIIGGAVVLLSLGYPLITYFEHVQDAVAMSSFLSGLAKSFVFGLLIAGIGCFRGLQTARGATAVGDSTTKAVVSGIVLVCVFDAAFAVINYALDI